MNLVYIKTFLLVCELGSLAAAARQLEISPAAVSKQISRLEFDLGVQLFVRTTRHLALTEIGSSYRLQCLRIAEEMEAATALISKVKAEPQGLLKVVCARHFGEKYIVPRIKGFLTNYPKLELHLELAERIPDIHAEEVDVVMGMSISAVGDVIQKRITTTSYAFCASTSYLQEFGTPRQPSDLISHRYITHSMRRPADRLVFGDEVVKVAPYLYLNDSQAMVRLALDGVGVVMVHRYMAEEFLEKGGLQELFTDMPRPDIPVYVAFAKRRFLAAKVRCFIDFMSANL